MEKYNGKNNGSADTLPKKENPVLRVIKSFRELYRQLDLLEEMALWSIPLEVLVITAGPQIAQDLTKDLNIPEVYVPYIRYGMVAAGAIPLMIHSIRYLLGETTFPKNDYHSVSPKETPRN